VTTVPVEVDDELLRLADAQAAEAGRPRSEVLAAALRRGLGGGQLSRLLADARKGPELSEDEAMELAKSELAAMRAERRGA
jgi:predicted transcriptional regulator